MSSDTSTTHTEPRAGNTGVIETFEGERWVSIDWFSGFVASDNSMNDWPDSTLLTEALETQYGADMKPASRQGFTGYQQGGVFWGKRHDGTFRELSGAAAARYCANVGRVSRLVRPSRIDIAYTFRTAQYEPGIAQQYYEMGPQNSTGRGPARKRVIYQTHGGGSTLYMGSASSETRVRLYDKYAEQHWSADHEYLWRAEVQFRGATARRVWDAIHPSPEPYRAMGAILQNEFQRENILLAHRISDSAVTVEPAQRTDKHAFDKLRWLENQVAPTVRTLKKLGYDQELREIFGLTSEG
jgi:DNA relaxase NicK